MTAKRKSVGVLESGDIRPGREDLEDGDDVAVMVGDDGRAYLAPRAVRNASPAQRDVLVDLQQTARALAVGNEQLGRLVDAARSRGLSWQTIGWSVGVSSEAVRKRYGGDENS